MSPPELVVRHDRKWRRAIGGGEGLIVWSGVGCQCLQSRLSMKGESFGHVTLAIMGIGMAIVAILTLGIVSSNTSLSWYEAVASEIIAMCRVA